MNVEVVSKVAKLIPKTSALFVCDIQERFRPLIQYMPSVIHVAKNMINSAHILNIPIVATEQYPKALGSTVDELKEPLKKASANIFEKKKFSMFLPEVETLLHKWKPKTILLVGIESHVCVLQTALDLVAHGYDVHLLADGISSQKIFQRTIAIERMKQSGVFITTSESAAFQLMESADCQGFKEIQSFFKESCPDNGL